MELNYPDIHFLSAAQGWLELGLADEARLEIARISPGAMAHPEVLQTRYLVCQAAQKWKSAHVLARTLWQMKPEQPNHWVQLAYSLRCKPGGGLVPAWVLLSEAAKRFPTESLIPYNLARYACQMGRLREAWNLLQKAAAVGDEKKIIVMALEEEDLQPLWVNAGTY